MDNPRGYLSTIIDGADQKKHTLVIKDRRRVSAAQEAASVFKMSLVAVLAHGVQLELFPCLPIVHKNANVTCTVLLLTLCNIQANQGWLPTKWFLQVDGAADNWCSTTVAFLAELVRHNVFEEITMSRMITKHTHCDIDGIFGILNKSLTSAIVTIGLFCLSIYATVTKKNTKSRHKGQTSLQVLTQVFDFISWLGPLVHPEFGGIRMDAFKNTDGNADEEKKQERKDARFVKGNEVHGMRIRKVDGHVVFETRTECTEEWSESIQVYGDILTGTPSGVPDLAHPSPEYQPKEQAGKIQQVMSYLRGIHADSGILDEWQGVHDAIVAEEDSHHKVLEALDLAMDQSVQPEVTHPGYKEVGIEKRKLFFRKLPRFSFPQVSWCQ